MRVLLSADPFIPVPPIGYGGIERIIDGLVSYFSEQGFETALVAHPDSTAPADCIFPWPTDKPKSITDHIRMARTLKKAVEEFSPDVIHSFSRLGYLTPLLRTQIPKVMSYQRATGGMQIRTARWMARNLVFTGCSEFIAGMGRKSGGSWHSIPNFVDVTRIPFGETVPDDAPLLFLSRIERIKGPDVAVRIARKSGRKLILAGNRQTNGAEGHFWKEEIEPHLGPDIEYVGEVNDAEKWDLLTQAAALLVPIRWDEPFGIVFIEALAAGVPVISCPRGALPEIVRDEETGFLVRNEHDGVTAVKNLSRLDRKTCRKHVTLNFDVNVAGQKYVSLYQSIFGDSPQDYSSADAQNQ